MKNAVERIFLAKFRFDTAENETAKKFENVLQKIANFANQHFLMITISSAGRRVSGGRSLAQLVQIPRRLRSCEANTHQRQIIHQILFHQIKKASEKSVAANPLM